MTRMAQAVRGLLAVAVGLALLMAAVLIGAVPAAAHGLESPPTVAAYTYGGAAPVVRGTLTNPSPPIGLLAPVRRGSQTAEGASARSRDFAVAAETGDAFGAGVSRVPSGWGAGRATRSEGGLRWTDPENQGNGIRIDRGNPSNSQVSQQVDHVVVNYGGRLIGRDGKPLPCSGSLKDNWDMGHIPLDEWLTWTNWFGP
jgi:hypothetical protein